MMRSSELVCVVVLLASSSSSLVARAWKPPQDAPHEFTPEIPIDSLDLRAARESNLRSVKGIVDYFSSQDIDVEITDDYVSKSNGVRHVHLRQLVDGLPIDNARGNVNLDSRGEIISTYHRFVAHTQSSYSQKPTLSAADAVRAFAANTLKRKAPFDLRTVPSSVLTSKDYAGLRPHDVILEASAADGSWAQQPMFADLAWIQLEDRSLRLAWQINVDFGDAWYDAAIDAHTGETLQLDNLIHWFSYEAYSHTTVSPDRGDREELPEHFDSEYSPLGWHDQGGGPIRNTQGNNVRTQENLSGDQDGWEDNHRPSPDANDKYDFPYNTSAGPLEYLDASITNLFYHNNLIHDFLYAAGFDEASGNFQQNNFGRGGIGNDPVTAMCQDGSGTDNAYFGTPVDGYPGRMTMLMWQDYTKDSSFDGAIIYHEFGHGVSNRLTGGPSNVNCLHANHGGGLGEGWSDTLAITYEQKPGNDRMAVYGMSTYMTDGGTIRQYPYSSDREVAKQRYSEVPGLGNHAMGCIWNAFLFEVYFNFVDNYGFDADWFHGDPSAGNIRFVNALVEGMKLQPCNPFLVDARDAFMDAARLNGGEELYCLAWDGFASRGMGVNAPRDASFDDYEVPAECGEIMRLANVTGFASQIRRQFTN